MSVVEKFGMDFGDGRLVIGHKLYDLLGAQSPKVGVWTPARNTVRRGPRIDQRLLAVFDVCQGLCSGP